MDGSRESERVRHCDFRERGSGSVEERSKEKSRVRERWR